MPVTPNLNLNVPVFNTPNWDQLMNANFNALDEYLSGNEAIPELSLAGLITQYNGVATVANGVPSILASYDAVAQGASIAPVALFTPSVAGLWKITLYIVVTQAASGGSPSIQGTIGYTDNDSGVVESITAAAYTGNVVGGLFVLSANCFVAPNQPINLSTAYAAGTGTPLQYAIHVRAELLG